MGKAMEHFNAQNPGMAASLALAGDYEKAGVRMILGYKMSATTTFGISFFINDEKPYVAARAELMPKMLRQMGIFNMADYVDEMPTPQFGTVINYTDYGGVDDYV